MTEDHDAEMDTILDELEAAGLVEVNVNEDGEDAMRLTPAGEQVARQMALSGDPDGMLSALLEARDSGA